jgi:hypothetical protein
MDSHPVIIIEDAPPPVGWTRQPIPHVTRDRTLTATVQAMRQAPAGAVRRALRPESSQPQACFVQAQALATGSRDAA